MDLKQLEYFVNVVDLGGFSRAARVLGIAQPAISRQIRSLEVELRQSLLLRNGRGAAPTEAGSACSITRAAFSSKSTGRAVKWTKPRMRRSATSSSACRRRWRVT
jgi:LysR family nitrogen assimilation transcriptional regulator